MNARIYLAKRVALSLGLTALGAALGFSLALVMVQDAAIAAGIFPAPGAIPSPRLGEHPLWQTARTLQTLANASAGAGAGLLLAYGVGDRYGAELTAVIAR